MHRKKNLSHDHWTPALLALKALNKGLQSAPWQTPHCETAWVRWLKSCFRRATAARKIYCMIVCVLSFNLTVVLPSFPFSCLAVMSTLAEFIQTHWWSFRTSDAKRCCCGPQRSGLTPSGLTGMKNVTLPMWWPGCWLSYDIHSRKKCKSGTEFRILYRNRLTPIYTFKKQNKSKIFVQHVFFFLLQQMCHLQKHCSNHSLIYAICIITTDKTFFLHWKEKRTLLGQLSGATTVLVL